MPQRELTVFRASCLASAVLGLGACATTPPTYYDHSAGGVPRTERDAGEEALVARTHAVTRPLFGLEEAEEVPAYETGGATVADVYVDDDPRPLLDMVDLAMLEEDAPPATATVASSVERVAADDLLHEVGSSETLWDIAKLTTGDANNWHVIADVNDLAPDATVYPGQTLVIPADLVRPSLVATPTALSAGAGGATGAALDDAGDLAGIEAEPLPLPAIPFALGAGETLWDFARRTTGDATNWRAIADANAFSDEQATRVFEGQSILVPNDLILERPAPPPSAEYRADAGVAAGPLADDTLAASAEGGDEPLVGTVAAGLAPAAAMTAAAPRSEAAGDPKAVPVALSDAAERPEEAVPGRTVATTFRDAPEVEEALAAIEREDPVGDAPEKIMVSGTFYPKAVYNEANFSSSLLMRVSPGTTLQVSRAVGPWYEVETEHGTGYVHARDIR